MKKLAIFLPIFVFAGLNNSYAYQKGYKEGVNIKRSLFGKLLTLKKINKLCLNSWEKYSHDNYIKENKETFLKGCKEALSGF